MPAGRQLLAQAQPSLDGAVVTADALHCQKKSVCVIVDRGSEYIHAVRDNQPKLARRAEGLLAKSPPLCPPGANAVQRQLEIPLATIRTSHRRQLKLPTDDNYKQGSSGDSSRSPGGREGRSPLWGI